MRPGQIAAWGCAAGIIASLLASVPARAAGYLCQKDKEIYWIKVTREQPDQPVPCAVSRWLGPDNQQQLWRATQDPEFCAARAREVRDKLQSYGWLCQPVDALLDEPPASPAELPSAGPPRAGGANVVM